MSENKTDSVITSLVNDLPNPTPAKDWFTNYWFSWISCFSLIALLTYFAAAMLPNDIHLPQNLGSFSFWLETGLWFTLSFVSALIGYHSAHPGRGSSKLLRMGIVTAFLLISSLMFRETPATFANEFSNEVHWHRGPCGIFILSTGIVSAMWMFFVLRRAAPTRLSFTGMWVAVSVGSLGSMFMHLVCTHESSAHDILWHVSPLILLGMLSAAVGHRSLRW